MGVQRVALRTRRWGPVITSQLASNAFGRVVPGGVAAAGAMQYAMLARAGVPAAAAASGMTASSLIVFGDAVRAAAAGGAGRARRGARWTRDSSAPRRSAALVFVLMFALGAACLLFDRPLIVLGRAAQWVRNRVMRRRRPPRRNLPDAPAAASATW